MNQHHRQQHQHHHQHQQHPCFCTVFYLTVLFLMVRGWFYVPYFQMLVCTTCLSSEQCGADCLSMILLGLACRCAMYHVCWSVQRLVFSTADVGVLLFSMFWSMQCPVQVYACSVQVAQSVRRIIRDLVAIFLNSKNDATNSKGSSC